jgi:hypothetical protein
MKNLHTKVFIFLILLLGVTQSGYSKGDPEKKPSKINKSNTSSAILKTDIQQGLDEALTKFNASLSTSPSIMLDNMEDLDLNVSSVAEENRSKAQKTMAYLDQNPDKVKAFLSFEDLVTLPVGLKQKLPDNSEVTIGIFSAEFSTTGAILTFFVRLKTKIDNYSEGESNERDLLFGVSGISFTKTGGLNGNLTAGLLGDYTIPGKNWTVVLKGGGDNIASPDLSKTYVTFSCSSFVEAKVTAEIVFPRNVVVPYDLTTRQSKEGRFKMLASATVNRGFRDMILTATGNEPFAVAGFEKYGFNITNAVVDMSDISGSPLVVFPAEYQHPDKTDPALWRGVALQQLTVLFPKEFEKESGTDFTVSGLFIDKSGFSGKVAYANSTGLVFGAQKWQFSMKKFGVEFLQNKFVAGGFAGDFYTPINGSPTEAGSVGFGYASIIKANGDVAFTVNADADDVPIKCWKAKGKIYQGSQITMQVVNGKFYPSCNLSGEMSIGANKINASNATEGFETGDDASVSFTGLIFENLNIATLPNFTFTIGNFRYLNSDNSKIAKIPVAITRLEKEAGAPSGEFWLGFGLKISLMKDKFAGSTDLTIRSYYDNSTGKLKLGSSTGTKIKLNSVYLSGGTTAFSIEGQVVLFETNPNLPGFSGGDFGKGFYGDMTVAIQEPFNIGVEAKALFGKPSVGDYRYGYFSIYTGEPNTGVAKPIPLSSKPGEKIKKSTAASVKTDQASGFKIPTGLGDLAINGIGLAIYFNMKPRFNPANVDQPIYTIDNTIPFGFKVMVGVQNYTGPTTYTGKVALDISLSSTSGINSIGLYGKVNITPPVKIEKLGFGEMVKSSDVNVLTNQASVDNSQEGFLAKASTLSDVTSNAPTPQATGIEVALGLLIDVPKGIAHAEATVKVNQNGIVGIGAGFLAGRAVLHFESGNTYVHLGKSPYSERIGLRFNNNFEFGAYLMIGKGIPPFPLPPKEVINFFPAVQARLNSVNANLAQAQTTSSGFALGANLKVSVDASGWLGYIKGYGVAGLDFMFADGAGCNGKWLGQGQIYGLADVDAGLGKKRLFRGAVGLYLYGQGLKPFYADGNVCVAYGRNNNKKLCLGFNVGSQTCN